MKEELDFYVVWGAGVPFVKHSTYAEAEAEAMRLLQKDPLRGFYVLRCASYVRVGEAIITKNVPAIPHEFALKTKATPTKTTTKKEK